MSGKELIDSLRSAADQKARSLWRDAEADAAAFRVQAEHRLEQMRSAAAQQQQRAANEHGLRLTAAADSRARSRRLAAELALANRLFGLARDSLSTLRQQDEERIFTACVRELPPLEWKTLRVNPEDRERARTMFPDAEVIADESISGGLDAATIGGRIRVVNTFEKRLERAWPILLPEMIRAVYHEAVDHGSAGNP
jgi:V/A-type H+-transporting ATPase subunit E